MIGFYTDLQLSLSNGTYKFYDISANDAVQLLVNENGLALSDIVCECKDKDIKMYIQKHQLNYMRIIKTPMPWADNNLNKGEKAILVKHKTIYTDIPEHTNHNDVGVKLLTLPCFSIIERIE